MLNDSSAFIINPQPSYIHKKIIMSLLQISEPNQSPAPHTRRHGVGIDLGTTNCLLSVVEGLHAKIIPIDGQNLMPSIVYYGIKNSKAHTLIGQQAQDLLLQHSSDDNKIADEDGNTMQNTIASSKRFIGKSFDDIKFSHPYALKNNGQDMPDFITAQGEKSPVMVAKDLLQKIKTYAQDAIPNSTLDGAVITVPAYFDNAQRQAVNLAAKSAGIHVLRLLNEPTAAALAYGLDKSAQNVLVYDLGGGTFDVSVLSKSSDIFEVVATGGNSALGGDDIDRLLAKHLYTMIGDYGQACAKTRTYFIQLAKQYKQMLSTQSTVVVDLPHYQLHTTLDNATLRQICMPIIKRTLNICTQVLQDAGLQKNDDFAVVLVGGSTRMPIIYQSVHDFFNKTPKSDINPDEVVAMGAAILANNLVHQTKDNVLLLDVTPLSLGLETMGGLSEVIIARNTPIPIKKQQEFTTHKDNQTGMIIHVVQGERDLAADCRSLGRFTLSGIPPLKAGIARVQVTFFVDANGELTVTARETTTNTQSQIEITPSYGLTQAQQEQLLQDGFLHAQNDKDMRMLREKQVECTREIDALTAALVEHGALLDNSQIQNLNTGIQNVRNAIAKDDKALLDEAHNKLKPLSDAFASLIMDNSIHNALSGTKANDWAQNQPN